MKCLWYTCIMVKTIVRFVAVAVVVFVAIVAIMLLVRTPSADRNWMEGVSRVSDARIEEDRVVITNVRDWQHAESGVVSKGWIDEVRLPLDQLVRVWFVLDPYNDSPWTGHSQLTFEFLDGSAYVFSVEARREVNEKYSAFRGAFREYEMVYVWGTERDYVLESLVYLGRPLRLHPLNLSNADAKGLLKAVVGATHELALNPRFYNTLTANCTNVLAKTINERYPGRVPYDLAWNLPGLAEGFLIEEGYITTSKDLETARTFATLAPHKEALLAVASSSPQVFSRAVRDSLMKNVSVGQ